MQYVHSVKSVPCVDCGKEYPPEVMELDHVRAEKEFSLAQFVIVRPMYTMEKVKAEVAKCEVRCPTCHRMRHWKEYVEMWAEEDDL